MARKDWGVKGVDENFQGNVCVYDITRIHIFHNATAMPPPTYQNYDNF